MTKEKNKNLTIRVTEQESRNLKSYLASQGISLQSYVYGLIKTDMQKKEKNFNNQGENKECKNADNGLKYHGH